jgi:hypothetical protein
MKYRGKWLEIAKSFRDSKQPIINMAEGPCESCTTLTKYSCINCSTFICNRVNCSLAELDETTAGWIAQKSVGYCKSCADDIISKPKCQEETPHKKPRVESNDSSTGTSSDESDSADSLLNQRQSTPKNSTKKRRKGKGKEKKVAGRKAVWKEANIDDMIDIIVNDEGHSRNLIFTNVKKQKNTEVYKKILNSLQQRYSQYDPPSTFPFTVVQMRTKFKWCVATCKKISLTISTKSGIKRIQDDKGYGQWFNLLYPLIKSRDSCQPEQAIEPDSLNNSISGSEESSSLCREPTPPMFVPIKSRVREKKKVDLNEAIVGTMEVMKKAIENDPTKDILALMRDEMKQAREQDLRFQQLIGTILQQQVSQQVSQSWPPYGHPAPGYGPNQFDGGQMHGLAPMQYFMPNTLPQHNLSENIPQTSETNLPFNYQKPPGQS